MQSQNKGENLIFLISQPRAGSTLTQKILGNHLEIHTTSEPWLMLHPIYAFREEGYQAEYDSRLSRIGLDSFLESMPGNGKNIYLDLVSQFYGSLYQQVIDAESGRFFLDKTPRYYNIIPELYSIFPKAKFIFLIRNPLAVLCSIIDSWIGDKWLGLRKYKKDLLDAPQLLIQGKSDLAGNSITIHYEEILKNADATFLQVCNYLGIRFSAEMLDYGTSHEKEWLLGDQKKVHKEARPDVNNSERWLEKLHHPQIWRFVDEYLQFLGEDYMRMLGYDYDKMQEDLKQFYPGKFSLLCTLPLDWALENPSDFSSLEYGYYPVRALNSIQRRGFTATAIKAFQKISI